jgi:hypothetical protein
MNDTEYEPKKESGSGIIWGSAMIAVAMIVSSFAYAVASSRYASAVAPTTQTASVPLPSSAAGPSCGVQ